LLFPGGDVPVYDDDPEQHSRTMTNITMAASFLVNLAMQAYDNGVYYPIWGVCAGWQILSMVLSQDLFLLDTVHGDENKNRNLSFTFSGSTTSRLWNGVPDYMMDALTNDNLAYFNHLRGISPE